MQQPTSTREVQREERDGGVTREGRGGMARGCTGSTTKGDAAQQQVIKIESQTGRLNFHYLNYPYFYNLLIMML